MKGCGKFKLSQDRKKIQKKKGKKKKKEIGYVGDGCTNSCWSIWNASKELGSSK